MERQKYYISTPIYYTSGNWHLGHCYTTVCCDVLARFKREQGCDVFYLTGTDEHGEKVEQNAAKQGKTPKQFADTLVDDIKGLWKLLDISYDKFIRTTDNYHERAVQKMFKKLYEQGDIYKSEYTGRYCVPCEAFWTDTQAANNLCPDCGRELVSMKEESYFFRLSKYADRLRKLLTETDFLSPASRVNEMVNFIDSGLNDISFSRTGFKWGIPVDFDSKHVIYVWMDALSNYITALGFLSEDDSLYKKYWPADVHVVGKEIVRFHTIIWPAILMALGEPLPKHVFGHGWLIFGGDKMSKSKGNVVDPHTLVSRYGLDAVRYYLLSEVPFGSDGVYSNENFLNRINSDLCNDLGNLVSRTAQMAVNYFGGQVPLPCKSGVGDEELINIAQALLPAVEAELDGMRINNALEEIFKLVSRANKYIDDNAPWILYKNKDTDRLSTVIYNLCEVIRISAIILSPFLTDVKGRIFKQIQVTAPEQMTLDSIRVFGALTQVNVVKGENLFDRLNVAKELDELQKLAEGASSSVIKEEAVPVKAKAVDKEIETIREQITIDDFSKIDLRTALVTACEKVEKSDKLLKLTLDVGGKPRTVVSGIAKHYTPEQMIGKTVVLVANLVPAKLRGILSEGMILCASSGDSLSIVAPEAVMLSGSEVR